MMRLAVCLVALGLLASPAAAQTLTYCGSLSSDGVMVPAETKILRDVTGKLSGSYTFKTDGEIHLGTLSRGHPMGPGRWQFAWRDEYGTGRLNMSFNADASAFSGVWGTGKDKPRQPWNGKLGAACLTAPTS